MRKVAAGIKGVETVIPGHSAVMTWNDFKEYGEFMRDLVAAVEQAKKDGKTADQAAADLKLPEKYKDYDMRRLKADVTTIYAELKAREANRRRSAITIQGCARNSQRSKAVAESSSLRAALLLIVLRSGWSRPSTLIRCRSAISICVLGQSQGQLDGTLVAHVTYLAHELNVTPAEALLDPGRH